MRSRADFLEGFQHMSIQSALTGAFLLQPDGFSRGGVDLYREMMFIS